MSGQGGWSVEGNDLIKAYSKVRGEICFGDPSWSEYTLSFKLTGLEGLASFMVNFHRKNTRNQCYFEIGDDRVVVQGS